METKLRFVFSICFVGCCGLQFALAQQIAKLKCQEYINSASVTAYGGDLSINSIIQEFKTTNCSTSVDLIVGGQEALVGEFPHQALLGYVNETDPHQIDFFCGGSLISEWYVLTAAHCPKPNIVRLGEHNLDIPNDGQQDFKVANFTRHPKYRSIHSYNDIALVQLTRQVEFSDKIRPACLWTTELFNMTSAVASGFGQTSKDNKLTSPVLMKAKLSMLNEKDCKKRFQYDMILEHGLKPEQLCVGSQGTDTCNGDSGGPLQVALDNETCFYHIVGVTSFGSSRCAVGSSMAVYTRVASYLDWIEPIVWKNEFVINLQWNQGIP